MEYAYLYGNSIYTNKIKFKQNIEMSVSTSCISAYVIMAVLDI